jgi:hypothetical protein
MTVLEAKTPTAKAAAVGEHDVDYMNKLPFELFMLCVSPSPQLTIECKDIESLRPVSWKYRSYLNDVWLSMVKRDKVRTFVLDHDFWAGMAALGDSADWQSSMEHITLELPQCSLYYANPNGNSHGSYGETDPYAGFLGHEENTSFQNALDILVCLPKLDTIVVEFNVSHARGRWVRFEGRRKKARDDFLTRMDQASALAVKQGIMAFLNDQFVPGLAGVRRDEFAVHRFA